MPELPPAAQRLVETNLQFLATVDRALASRVGALTTTLTQPVIDGNAVVDIDVGGDRLYGRPAHEFAAEQLASFMAEPVRFAVKRPNAETLHDPCSAALVRRIEARLHAEETPLLDAPPSGQAGVLLVLGVGLGAHLLPLIEATCPRHVVVVEPIDEFLRHSLATVDWAALHHRCTERGATCTIIARDDPDTIIAGLDALLTQFGETTIDGSQVYIHYTTPVTHAAAGKVNELFAVKSILKGYFADECLMVDNTSANVATHPFRLVEGALRPPLGVPAFVVGAGPSLDASVAAIRREHANAVIFTAGSALQALLAAGIVPDYHVEKENLFLTVQRLRHIMARNAARFPAGTFTGIRLLASTTVDPGVLELFDEHYLFLRSALSSTAMFGAGHRPLDGTSPYSANAALTLAATLGFREIYLFGCDCGTRDAGRHHAAETVYYTLDGGEHAATPVKFEQRRPANFAGEVLTNPYFDWSRWTHELVIAAAGLTVRNCSDGVRIAGAPALRPEELDLTGRGFDRAAIADRVLTQSTWYPAGGLLQEQDVAGAVAAWDDLAAALRRRLAALRRDAPDIHAWHHGLADLFADATPAGHGTAAMLAGTARTLPALASYYLNRIADPADAAAFFAWFQDTSSELFEQQLTAGAALLATVAARAQGSQAVLYRAG